MAMPDIDPDLVTMLTVNDYVAKELQRHELLRWDVVPAPALDVETMRAQIEAEVRERLQREKQAVEQAARRPRVPAVPPRGRQVSLDGVPA